MPEAALRTSQAARELGVSADIIRKLVKLNLIECELSAGGHARIPLPVIQQLKRDGLPPIPCEIPDDPGPGPERETADHRPPADFRHSQVPELLDEDEGPPFPPSDAVAAAEDESKIEEYRARTDKTGLERLRLQFERADAIRIREQRDSQAEQARQREEAWRSTLRRWLEYAITQLPPDLDSSAQLGILEGVVGALEKAGQYATEWATRRAVDGQIASGLAPWHARKQNQELIEAACRRMPTNDATWRFRAIEAATKTLGILRPDANQFEKQTAVEHAIKLVTADFEYIERREAKIKNTSLADATSNERDSARESVRMALEALPIGSSERELEAARVVALEPYLSVIRTRKDREMREGLTHYWYFTYYPGDSDALKEEIRQAIDAFPEGTPQRQLEEIRDKIRDKRRAEHRAKEAAEAARIARINHGLSCIHAYVRSLREQYEIEIPSDFNPLWGIVRAHLEKEISSETPFEEVEKLVRRRVRRHFNIRPRS